MSKAPIYKVYIDGKVQRDITEYVEKLTFEDCSEEDSCVKIEVYEAYALTAADDDDFVTGKYIAFQFGYIKGAMSETHRVRIVDIEVNYTRLKLSLILKCLDKGHVMRKRVSPKVWKGVSTADIAATIAKDYGLQTEIDPKLKKVWASVPQGNRSDMDLLKYLAIRETGGNYVCYIRGYTLYVVKRATDKESSLTYTWGDGEGTVISFKTNNRDSKKTGAYMAVHVDKPIDDLPKGSRDNYQNAVYKTWRGKINNHSEAKTGTLGEYKPEFDFNSVFAGNAADTNKVDNSAALKPVVSDSDVSQGYRTALNNAATELSKTNPEISKAMLEASQDPEELSNLANHHKKKHYGIEATLRVEGNPTIRPNTIITMANVAKVHLGNWLIIKVKHEIADGTGYVTTMELRKNGAKKGKTAATDKNAGKGPDTKTDNVKIPMFDANGKLLGYSTEADAKKGIVTLNGNVSDKENKKDMRP